MIVAGAGGGVAFSNGGTIMKLLQLGISNYRGFCRTGTATHPADPNLDFHWLDMSNDIIVVVGENNGGKTSLLQAYRDFRSSGFAPAREDFFRCETSHPIIMELRFQAGEEDDLANDKTGKWYSDDRVAKVRKVWATPTQKAVKLSYDWGSDAWVEGGFGGFDSILQNRLPEPIHLAPHMAADELKGQFEKLFKEIIQRHIAGSENVKIIESALHALSLEIEQDQYITDIAGRVSVVAANVFPGLGVQIRNPPSDKGIGPLLEKQAEIELTLSDSPALGVARHGQGSQRAFLLSALNILVPELAAATRRAKAKGAPEEAVGHTLLQIEEPELFLSPTAVRRMRGLLYELAAQDGVQVMACSHSPVMVDFSRPKQTVALVERTENGSVIHQSETSNVPKERRDALKLIYQLNPLVAECLFANKVVLVEGETEFAALTHALASKGLSEHDLDVHIVDCGGKPSLPAVQKVLRDFGKRYIAVHDLDVTYGDRASDQAGWDRNEAIWNEIAAARSDGVIALGFVFGKDFEGAHGYEARGKHKVLSAMNMIDAHEANGSFSETPLASLLDAIANWKSPFETLEDVSRMS